VMASAATEATAASRFLDSFWNMIGPTFVVGPVAGPVPD
jgi:hypothetical protein